MLMLKVVSREWRRSRIIEKISKRITPGDIANKLCKDL